MIDWNTINAATIRDLRSRVAELEEALTIVTRSKGATPEFDWESYYADTLAAAEKALVSPDVSATQREGIARRVAMGQPEAVAAVAVMGDRAGDACSSRPGRFGETVEFVDGVTWWVPPKRSELVGRRYPMSDEAVVKINALIDRQRAEKAALLAVAAAARVLVFDGGRDSVDKRLGALGLDLAAALDALEIKIPDGDPNR